MIDIREGELSDLLRFSTFNEDVDAQCFSFALKRGLSFVLERLIRIQTHSAIGDQPEETIDALAQEFRAPYYDETLPLDVKRQIVESAIIWHYYAGTPSAVKELMQVVFGDGAIIEWWDFEDPPFERFLFDLETNAPLRPETWGRVLDMLDGVKNVRSHLRRLVYKRKAETDWAVGLTLKCIPERYTASWPEGERDTGIPSITGGSFQSMPMNTAAFHESESEAALEAALAFALARYYLRIAQTPINEGAAFLQANTSGSLSAAEIRLPHAHEKTGEAALPLHFESSVTASGLRFTQTVEKEREAVLQACAGIFSSLVIFRLAQALESQSEAALQMPAGAALEMQTVRLTQPLDITGSIETDNNAGFAFSVAPMRTSIRSPDKTARMTGRLFSGELTPIRYRTNA